MRSARIAGLFDAETRLTVGGINLITTLSISVAASATLASAADCIARHLAMYGPKRMSAQAANERSLSHPCCKRKGDGWRVASAT